MAAIPLCTFILGHFVENDGEHYVFLADEYNSDEVNNEAESLADLESNDSQDMHSAHLVVNLCLTTTETL